MTDGVLIISGTVKGRERLASFARENLTAEPDTASNASEARRMLIDREYGLIIIDLPLADESGEEFACGICLNSAAGVIVTVRPGLFEKVFSAVAASGVFVLSKPVGRRLFSQALKLVTASRNRILGLRAENIKLQQKITEVRLVHRAKYTLIQYLSMTEPQAHRFIEKTAMDMRVTRREVAESILKTYET